MGQPNSVGDTSDRIVQKYGLPYDYDGFDVLPPGFGKRSVEIVASSEIVFRVLGASG